jgi:hypothetical protein
MDWLEILLVLIFFGAPLLGRIFKTSPPPDALPPPEAEPYGEEPARIPAPAGARRDAPGDWSAGWGEWPGMETEEDEEAAAVEEARAAGVPDPEGIHTAEAVSLEPVTPVVYQRPLPAPVASLDLVEVDRKAEHERLHRRFARPAAPPARARPDRLADHLRTRRELRRAILLTEVLGPPRALRPLEEDR